MQIPTRLRDADFIESLIFWLLLGSLCLLYLWPIWQFRYLPVLDLPVHLQMASAIHNLHDPSFAFDRYFEMREGLLPYWTTYGVVNLLAYLMPIDAALKALLSLIALGIVGAVLLCLRAFGRSRFLVFFSLPLIYDVNATYGYFAFRLSVVLCLICLALLRLNLTRPRLWRELLLAAAAVATYFTHAHGFALLTFLGLWVLALGGGGWKATLRSAAAAIPALALSAQWYFSALFSGGEGGKVHTPHLPLIRLMELVPHRLLNSITDNSDEVIALGMFVCWVGMLAISPRPAGHKGIRATLTDYLPLLLMLLMLVAYFAVPNKILTPTTRIYGINYRFLLVIALLATLVPRLRIRRWRMLTILPVVLLCIFYGRLVHREYQGFNQRYKAFDQVVTAMKPGKRVLAYTYNTRDPRFTVPLLGHFVGYYHGRKGGVPSSGHTFGTYRYMPVKLKKPQDLPEPNYRGPNNWAWLGPRYDYFLIADQPGSKRSPFPLASLRLVAEGGPWRVYEKR